MYDRYISLSIESTEDFDTELIMNCGAPTVSLIGYYYYLFFFLKSAMTSQKVSFDILLVIVEF